MLLHMCTCMPPTLTSSCSKEPHCPSPNSHRLAWHECVQITAPSTQHAQHRGPCSTAPLCFSAWPQSGLDYPGLFSAKGKTPLKWGKFPRISTVAFADFQRAQQGWDRGRCAHTHTRTPREVDEQQSPSAPQGPSHTPLCSFLLRTALPRAPHSASPLPHTHQHRGSREQPPQLLRAMLEMWGCGLVSCRPWGGSQHLMAPR